MKSPTHSADTIPILFQGEMHTGFTGTRKGLTAEQRIALAEILCSVKGWWHHGDCVGADAQSHLMARNQGLMVDIHPPIDSEFRAFRRGDIYRRQAGYVHRNRHIVDATSSLIACPDGPERLRSGTWSTIRYARKLGRPITIIMPDGSVLQEHAPAVSIKGNP